MAVRILRPEQQRRRSLAIQALDEEWIARQVAKGVDGPVPDDRRGASDYNQHVPAMEATGEDQDWFFRRLDEILSTP